MARKREIIQYRGHQIIANSHGAMIHPQKHLINGSSIDECLDKAKAYVDSKYAERQSLRRAPHVGTIDDYAEALNGLKLGDHERAMLSAHYNAADRSMTATELANSSGWNSYSSANSHYGKLGKRIAEHVGLKLDGGNDEAWTNALAEYDSETHQWTMHDEVAMALKRLNMI